MTRRHVVVLDELETIEKFRPVHYNTSGLYRQGRAGEMVKHLVVASINEFDGKIFDWAAYEGWTDLNSMSRENQIQAVAEYGDKIWEDRARQLAEPLHHELKEAYYRE